MSKLFISNEKAFYERARDLIEKSEYKLAFSHQADGIYTITTKKLFVDHCNAVSMDTDCVLTNGTFIYNRSAGENTWKQLYADWQEKDIPSIRKNATGNYAVGIKNGKSITVFTEATAAFELFYYYENEKWLISNSLHDMAQILADRITVNIMNLLEETVRTIIGNETIFNGIVRLNGEEYLECDQKTLSLKKLVVNYPIVADDNYDTNLKEITTAIREKAADITCAIGNPTMNMTGGIDVRMSLAAYLSVGAKPVLEYGIGNSILAGSLNGDLEINRIYSQRYGLPLHLKSWEMSSPYDKYWNKYIRRYGTGAYVYSASEHTMNFYEQSATDIIATGYFGELYRHVPWMEKRTASFFTIDEFIGEWYLDLPIKEIIKDIPGLKEHIRGKWISICEKYHLNPGHIKNEDCFYLFYEYRKKADVHVVNLVNRMKYAVYLASEYEILSKTRVNKIKMDNARFMLDILDRLYPDILEVPFFSHCTRRHFDRHIMALSDPILPWYRKIGKKIPFKYKKVLKRIYPAFAANPSQWNNTTEEIRQKIASDVERKKLRKVMQDTVISNFAERDGLRNLVSLSMKLRLIESIQGENFDKK